MDRSLIKPELDASLVEKMKRYLAAVDAGDLDAMEQFYADDFVNIRYDKAAQAANIPKGVYMNLLRSWAAQSDGAHPLAAAQTTHFVATTQYGEYASVLLIRPKGLDIVSYNFVWRNQADTWRIVREFTFQDALPQPG
ncbi:MAG TPA: hypothetical protein VJ843_01785 [Candidatus Saccharimonadales bacterium]|nr:hypothetical protein [Candidatus Saccharimonadales bacterium]